ncbi:hypothetical protein CERZMDRAFT_83877 [Cercospora zeae-maydis SCOH1-5]|uniref:Uncharacterized protein n=1 Tax=Cercospora zeae-maydis SCOH1-5 TaxID=717836 RepID=A0A6A6FK21_9PEZI|nr:hypothetical protein CERZMDRAFT_83877 [Cercospora zeae-maydis SCOH1-5]
MSCAIYKPRSVRTTPPRSTTAAMAKSQQPTKGVAYKPMKKNQSGDVPAADASPLKISLPLPTMSPESDHDDEDDMPLTASNASLINRKRKRATTKAQAAPPEKAKQARVSSPAPRSREAPSRRHSSAKPLGDNAPTKEAMCRAMRQGPKAGLKEWSDAEKRDFCMIHLPAYFGTVTMKTSPFQIDQWIESWWNGHGKQLWAKIKRRERERVSSGGDETTPSRGDILKTTKGGKAPQAAMHSVIQPQLPLSKLAEIGRIPKKRKASAADEDEMPAARSIKKTRTGANESSSSRELSYGIDTRTTGSKHISKAPEQAVLRDLEQGNISPSRLSGREAIALAENENRGARQAAELKVSEERRVQVDNVISKRLEEPDYFPKVTVPSFGGHNVLESLGVGKK